MAKMFGHYPSYSFVDKSPMIDLVRTVIKDSGMTFREISDKSGVSYGTIANWLYGKTRRPQEACLNAVLRVCNYKLDVVSINYQSIIMPTPFIPKPIIPKTRDLSSEEVRQRARSNIRYFRDNRRKKEK